MEVKQKGYNFWRHLVCLAGFFLLPFLFTGVSAQEAAPKYSIRDGRMVIEVPRNVSESVLDLFIRHFELSDLALKNFILTSNADTLVKQGWKVSQNNKDKVVLTKVLMALDDFHEPADKRRLSEKHAPFANLFAADVYRVQFGSNRFRNKYPFAILDSVVTFFLRNNLKAQKVFLAGTFNNWSPQTLPMTRTDSGWIIHVKLGPGKHRYKFVSDGHWIVDNDNLQNENDGEGNVNSVFFKPNTVFVLNGHTSAKRVFLSGSFNNWKERDLAMQKTPSGWVLPVYLPEGTHTYKFIADGEWLTDPQNNDRLPDGHNGYNSVIRNGKAYTFRLNGFSNANKVFVAGSFNGWRSDELPLNKTATGWELPYHIGPGNHEYRFMVDGKWVTDRDNPLTSNSKDGNSFLIIQPNYTFRIKGFANAKTVCLSGDFNGWAPAVFPMRREGDEWVFSLYLAPGKHRYKLVVDGAWVVDPTNKLWEQNEYGTGNSVLWLGR